MGDIANYRLLMITNFSGVCGESFIKQGCFCYCSNVTWPILVSCYTEQWHF